MSHVVRMEKGECSSTCINVLSGEPNPNSVVNCDQEAHESGKTTCNEHVYSVVAFPIVGLCNFG